MPNEQINYTCKYSGFVRIMDQTKDQLLLVCDTAGTPTSNEPVTSNKMARAIYQIANSLVVGGQSSWGLTLGLARQLSTIHANLKVIVNKDFTMAEPPELVPGSIDDDNMFKLSVIYINMLSALKIDDGQPYLKALQSFPKWVTRLTEVPEILSQKLAVYLKQKSPEEKEELLAWIPANAVAVKTTLSEIIAGAEKLAVAGHKLAALLPKQPVYDISVSLGLLKFKRNLNLARSTKRYMATGFNLQSVQSTDGLDLAFPDDKPILVKISSAATGSNQPEYRLYELTEHGQEIIHTKLDTTMMENLKINFHNYSAITPVTGQGFQYLPRKSDWWARAEYERNIEALYEHIFSARTAQLTPEQIKNSKASFETLPIKIEWEKNCLTRSLTVKPADPQLTSKLKANSHAQKICSRLFSLEECIDTLVIDINAMHQLTENSASSEHNQESVGQESGSRMSGTKNQIKKIHDLISESYMDCDLLTSSELLDAAKLKFAEKFQILSAKFKDLEEHCNILEAHNQRLFCTSSTVSQLRSSIKFEDLNPIAAMVGYYFMLERLTVNELVCIFALIYIYNKLSANTANINTQLSTMIVGANGFWRQSASSKSQTQTIDAEGSKPRLAINN